MHACQMETATCIEISEHIWRPLILANKTSRFFFRNKTRHFSMYVLQLKISAFSICYLIFIILIGASKYGCE